MQTHEEGTLRLTKVAALGPYDNNAYIIADTATNEALIVDMPAGSERLLEAASGLLVKAVLLTHTHPDHWAAYDLVKDKTGAPVLCHPAELIMPASRIDQPLADGDEVAAGSLTVRAVHTPGHTPGSTCFLAGGFLLSGDTLFPGGPGRTQTPQDLQQTLTSISNRLLALADETVVLPGHGADTTVREARSAYQAFASRPHPADLCGDVSWEM